MFPPGWSDKTDCANHIDRRNSAGQLTKQLVEMPLRDARSQTPEASAHREPSCWPALSRFSNRCQPCNDRSVLSDVSAHRLLGRRQPGLARRIGVKPPLSRGHLGVHYRVHILNVPKPISLRGRGHVN